MIRRAKQMGEDRRPAPEYRLWLSYGGFLLAIVGLLVFGIRFEQAAEGHWNVTPIVSTTNGPRIRTDCADMGLRSALP